MIWCFVCVWVQVCIWQVFVKCFLDDNPGSQGKRNIYKDYQMISSVIRFFCPTKCSFLISHLTFACLFCLFFPVCKQTNNMVAQKKWNKYRYDARCSITKPRYKKKPNIESNKQTNKQITQKQKEKMLHLILMMYRFVSCITFQLIIFFAYSINKHRFTVEVFTTAAAAKTKNQESRITRMKMKNTNKK